LGKPSGPGAARLRAGLVALPDLLAARAADREVVGSKPGRCDFLLAGLATPVAPLVHLLEGQIDLGEHARPPIGHCEPHLVVRRERRAITKWHALDLLAARGRLDATLAFLSELGHELGALLEEQRLQLRLDVGGSLARSCPCHSRSRLADVQFAKLPIRDPNQAPARRGRSVDDRATGLVANV